MTQLLAHQEIDVNRTNQDRWSPLFIAAFKGNVDVVRALLQAGADTAIEATSPPGSTALSVAQNKKHGEVVALLLGDI